MWNIPSNIEGYGPLSRTGDDIGTFKCFAFKKNFNCFDI